jgi:glycosyltransferase involved in cell wall biosynthesis
MINEFIKKGHPVDYYFPFQNHFSSKGDLHTFTSIKIKGKLEKTNNFVLKFMLYKFLEFQFSKVITKTQTNYDLLIIVTPSIFQTKILRKFKKKFPQAKTLLLLKDIFPDNALDLGILNKKFPLIIAYKYFKKIEKKLYHLVDKIGVMTELNRQYILLKNPSLNHKIFVSPNSAYSYEITKKKSRSDLNLPDNVLITFIGNIGVPQDPYFLLNLIKFSPKNFSFLIIGTGAKDYLFSNFQNDKVIFVNKVFTQEDIDQYLINSDYGLVLLNYSFNVPNFPSKILSYLNANLPILAFTNEYNDLKELIYSKQFFGEWYRSNNLELSSFNFKLLSKKGLNFSQKKKYEVEEQINNIISLFRN